MHTIIPLEEKEAWAKALSGIKHTFGHTWENCQAMTFTTGEKPFLYCFEKEGVRIVCPLIERNWEGYREIVKPIGFSGFVGNKSFPEFPSYWESFVRSRKYLCGFLGVNPVYSWEEYYEPADICSEKTVYLIDLAPSLEDIFSSFSKGRRHDIRKSERLGFEPCFEKDRLRDFFLKNYAESLLKKGFSRTGLFAPRTLSFLVDLSESHLIGAYFEGEMVGVSLTVQCGSTGDFLILVSHSGWEKCSTFLIWQRLKFLKEKGVKVVNLGGDSTPGIGDFKKRFGSRAVPLQSAKQIYQPRIYESLCRQQGIDPGDRSGFFPAYRKKERLS